MDARRTLPRDHAHVRLGPLNFTRLPDAECRQLTPEPTSDDASVPLDWDALVEQLNRRIGLETSPSVTEIDPSMIRRFAAAIGSTSQLYFNEDFARTTQYGGMIAPPAFVSTFVVGHIPEIFAGVPALGRTLHTDDTARIWRPIRTGDRITSFARYVGAARKDGRRGPMLFQSADLILNDALHQPVAEVLIVSVNF
jgi:acyl dehydratase